jgi:hypothetical protein
MKVEPPSKTKLPFYSINVDPKVSEGFSINVTLHFYYDSTLGSIKWTDENRPAKANGYSI